MIACEAIHIDSFHMHMKCNQKENTYAVSNLDNVLFL